MAHFTGLARSMRLVFVWGLAVAFCAVTVASSAEARSRKRKKRSHKSASTETVEASPAERSSASGEPMRVVVVPVEGKDGAKLRAIMVREIEKTPSYSVVPADEVNQAADKLGVMLGSEARDYSAVAAEVKASAIVTGKVTQGRKKSTLDVQVRNGVDGEVLGESSWSGRNSRAVQKQVKKTFWKKTGGVIAMGTAPQPEQGSDKSKAVALGAGAAAGSQIDAEKVPGLDDDQAASKDSETPKDSEAKGDASTKEPRLALDMQAGIGIFTRSLTYNDPDAKIYTLSGAPAVSVAGDIYPLSFFTGGFASMIGITGSFWQGFAMKSQNENDSSIEYPTNAWGYTLGGKIRVPFEKIDLQIIGAYGQQLFSIKADGSNPRPDVPNVRYDFIRAGLGTRFDFAKSFFAGAQAAYLFVLDTGEIGSAAYFPNATAGGIDGQLSFGYKFGGGLELRAQGDFRRYFYSMNPEVGDARIVGGAVDQYLAGTLAVAYRWMK